MNVAVAPIDRRESRARPQTPWPLVHPFPSRVPNPTSNPPMISKGADEVTSIWGWPITVETASAPAGRPITKATACIHGGPASAIRSAEAAIPLTPAIRPDNSRKSPAAAPINKPPMTASTTFAIESDAITEDSPEALGRKCHSHLAAADDRPSC